MNGHAVENEGRLKRWHDRLGTATLSRLPVDYQRPTPPRLVESLLERAIDDEVLVALRKLSASVTQPDKSDRDKMAAVILTAFIVLVQRLTGDESICVGTNVFSGPSNEFSSGSRQYPLRIDFTASQLSFSELIYLVCSTTRAHSDDIVPLSAILEHLRTKAARRENAPSVLFYTGLFHSTTGGEQDRALLSSLGFETELAVNVQHGEEGRATLQLLYNSLLFSSKRVSIITDQLIALVVEAARHPEKPVGALCLLTPSQTAFLPDPVRNLGWCDFRGAIHDIFSDNAELFPERECIVETPSTENPRVRSFTYRQIHHASNILAHHLIRSGIKRGDVVMVYAYRGVDLVVSVMGILKAGATFSVVDPQYPANRQIIYLSVAKPRALISIAKAGLIAPSVLEYTEKNLDLLTRVPELILHDDGSLWGGKLEQGAEDVLLPDQASASIRPAISVGPDSVPTLSFTSGSEGVPKGVRGRHFSLAYYFDWMSQRFCLSDKDRFTMLSGIAHDPIQRDIFTPLFLGAKLIVPPVEDITPGRLAQWARDNAVTVTHLTPAMGQLMTGQASCEIPSLHHAFFVGDILTKRDCLQLQRLGSNVAVVNMYGTTETQRAVSYFEVPSISSDPSFLENQNDVISAGQGMYNVQLLVINRCDPTQICGVGEIGEIYVRAGGLAEGYLGHDELTQKKFVHSWFVPEGYWKDTSDPTATWHIDWKGPRDRLYRSGDLGRYSPAGDVDCSGRADDQVKIRGFRIELGEINTHLSRHPHVRENVTLVRRNKDEEPTLVAYVVPKQSKELDNYLSADSDSTDGIVHDMKIFRRLIKDIQEYLRTKLPSYAVPSVIIPMNRLPLNPNGKIDKPALPFPDTAQLAAAAKTSTKGGDANLSESQRKLRDLWLRVLPYAPASLSLDDDFFKVGGHSLAAARLMIEFQKTMALDVPMSVILAQPATLERMAADVDKLQRGESFVVESRDDLETNGKGKQMPKPYDEDARELATQLPATFPSRSYIDGSQPHCVFITGATGFVGVYLLAEFLSRKQDISVIAHVRAQSKELGLIRLRKSCEAYGVWSDAWATRIHVVTGSLDSENLGMSETDWQFVANNADAIVHNGARVHWLDSYNELRATNVLGTIKCLELCTVGKPKVFTFISSTSVLDNEYYVNLSQLSLEQGGSGVLEADDLEGSAVDLGTGYGQSKWSSEYLCRLAGRKGLKGSIVRPGYILGHSRSGVTNTDDFLIRMIKGCVELSELPDIHNTVNMVPVDHVCRVIGAATLNALPEFSVVHVTGHPRMRLNVFLGLLSEYGYSVKVADYLDWRKTLKEHVFEQDKGNALLPLLSFVQENLPSNTKAPELDDRNAAAVLKKDAALTGEDLSEGRGVGGKEMGVYLAYLNGIGFLPPPSNAENAALALPEIELDQDVLQKLASVGGRGTKA